MKDPNTVQRRQAPSILSRDRAHAFAKHPSSDPEDAVGSFVS